MSDPKAEPMTIGGFPVQVDTSTPSDQIDVSDKNGRRPLVTNIGKAEPMTAREPFEDRWRTNHDIDMVHKEYRDELLSEKGKQLMNDAQAEPMTEWPGQTTDGTYCQGPTREFNAILEHATKELREEVADLELKERLAHEMLDECFKSYPDNPCAKQCGHTVQYRIAALDERLRQEIEQLKHDLEWTEHAAKCGERAEEDLQRAEAERADLKEANEALRACAAQDRELATQAALRQQQAERDLTAAIVALQKISSIANDAGQTNAADAFSEIIGIADAALAGAPPAEGGSDDYL